MQVSLDAQIVGGVPTVGTLSNLVVYHTIEDLVATGGSLG